MKLQINGAITLPITSYKIAYQIKDRYIYIKVYDNESYIELKVNLIDFLKNSSCDVNYKSLITINNGEKNYLEETYYLQGYPCELQNLQNIVTLELITEYLLDNKYISNEKVNDYWKNKYEELLDSHLKQIKEINKMLNELNEML